MSPSGQVAAALGVHIGEFLNVGDRIIIAVVQVRIRVAAVADVPAVVRLSAALFAEDAGAYDKYTDQSWPQREGAAYFAAVVGGEHTRGWLAELDGRPVASLVGRVLRENSLRPVRVADLESIYVLPGHRGAGIGSALVAHFRAWARTQEAERASVTAYAVNTGAIAFYRRHGFSPKSLTLESDL